MATSKNGVKSYFVQHHFREVCFTSTVKAETLAEALEIGETMDVREVLDNSPEWVDGKAITTGVYEI